MKPPPSQTKFSPSGLPLTVRQQEILELITEVIRETGFPPTRAEIAARLGFKSPNAAEEHLKALARKGSIELAPGSSRGIRLPGGIAHALKVQASLQDESFMQLSLPLIGRVAAGSPMLAAQHIEAEYKVDPNLFSEKPDYLLKVRGLSMRDIGIMEGDLLAVKRAKQARNGQIVVARIGEEVTVKRFFNRGDSVELIAENRDFAPIIVKRNNSEFELEGIGVGLLRVGGFS